MEKDDEIDNVPGSKYTTEFRGYDPRLGRWLSLDPLEKRYPSMSPYAAYNNNPIYWIDPSGAGGEATVKTNSAGKTTATVESTVYVYTDKSDVDIVAFAKVLEASLNQQLNAKNEDGGSKSIRVIKPSKDENGNKTYKPGSSVVAEVKYIVTVVPVEGGPDAVLSRANSNQKMKNNFYLITSDSENPTAPGNNHNYGGNSGVLNANADPKIWGHEFSHNLGWLGSSGQYGGHEETDLNSIMFYPINANSRFTKSDTRKLNGGNPASNKAGYGYGKLNYIYRSTDKYQPINSNEVRPKMYE
jgi:RHS repeat-associated protein